MPTFIYQCHNMFDCPAGGFPGLYVAFTPSERDDELNVDIVALRAEEARLSAEYGVSEHEARGCKVQA